jgi:hypothetical protein|nr:MAG TPA: hypothetical protein [Caudoviricetes sp.]DAS11438.1 MAG TPA: hypothetical protein [Caudoviricetes sp.]
MNGAITIVDILATEYADAETAYLLALVSGADDERRFSLWLAMAFARNNYQRAIDNYYTKVIFI